MQNYVCRCFFTRNLYVKKYNAHLVYEDDETFREQNAKILQARGCVSDGQVADILSLVRLEVQRRKEMFNESKRRQRVIAQTYVPLHPEIYMLQESQLDAGFLHVVKYCKTEASNARDVIQLLKSEQERVYSLPIFTKRFCIKFVEEMEHFESSSMPKGRPNTMNNYGVLLNELGFDEGFISPLREHYLNPIAHLLYEDYGGGKLDSHKAFVVKYKEDEDTELGFHYDNAEVTINISLGKEFTDSQLYFGKMRNQVHTNISYTECVHVVSHGILHRGQHMHGALPITSGERYNLIIWMRASSVRNKLCPMCDQQPQLVPTEGWGDGFTEHPSPNREDGNFVQSCSLL